MFNIVWLHLLTTLTATSQKLEALHNLAFKDI